MVAGTWSACRVLRHIVETETTSIVLEDDWIFHIDYRKLLKKLDNLHPETEIAVLMCKRFGGEEYDLDCYNADWIKGVPASAGAVNVYTPKGANFVLNLFSEHKAQTVEKVVQGLEFPVALTINHEIISHPLLMGYSRANPKNNREDYVNAYERWERGYEPLLRNA